MTRQRYFNVLVGPMSSGKTGFAGRFWASGDAVHHVMHERAPDRVDGQSAREALRRSAGEAWRGLVSETEAWLESGSPACFVADGLFMSRQARQAALDLIPGDSGVKTVGWFLDTPVSTLIERFRARMDAGEFACVPKEVLLNQCLCFELPSPDERFDMWIRVPVPDQRGELPDGEDPLGFMAHRVMFADGDPTPRCDFLDEAKKAGHYSFKDMGVRE